MCLGTQDMLAEDEVVTRSFCGTEQYMSPEMLLQQVSLVATMSYIMCSAYHKLLSVCRDITGGWTGGVWVF